MHVVLAAPLLSDANTLSVCAADVSLALLVFLSTGFNQSQASLSSFGRVINRPGLSPSFLLQTRADLQR